MKKLLLFILILNNLFAIAQVDIQTNFELNAPLPIDTRFEAATTIARDAFPSVQRWEGMTVYVVEDSTNYQLVGGVDNSDWLNIQNKFSGDSITIGGKVIRFNEAEGVFEFETVSGEVTWQGGLEDLEYAYNNTGSLIENGTPVFLGGPIGDTIATLGIAFASIDFTALRFTGLTTEDIADETAGFVACRGLVHDMPTSGLSTTGATFLGEGVLTSTKPAAPSKVVIAGGAIKIHATEGTFYVNPSLALKRTSATRDYNFTSQGVGAGTYFIGGDYDFSTTDTNLTQASTTVTYGTLNDPHGKHASVITGGAGTVDTGVIGLRVTGDSYDDSGGVITVADADTIITDITSVALDEYFEGKKFISTVTFELIVMSGSPTTYSLDFNYGLAKYEDVGNRDFYITTIEMGLNCSFSDASFNVELLHHKNTGWTYAAAGFIPGDGAIESWSNTFSPNDDVINGNWYPWKIIDINQFIDGDGFEGVLWRITTGASNTVQSMNLHIGVEVEE